MATALNNLTFMVNLIDRVSQPMGRVMQSIDQASRGFQSGFARIGVGTAGLVGAAYSMNSLLEPTKDMQRALGEVRSLGVANETLDSLQKTALSTSTQFGESASDFVRSAYDIQSAIAGLRGDELPAFTRASAILAKGTKATTQEVTGFVGTMYGIFQKNADAMGRAQWVEQLAGQTAEAVKIFKTTGQGMANAFESLGAAGQVNNIAMSEQIAILGRLQATMSGSEAGTKYRSFLDNVGKAQAALNLQFTDAQGRMLPIIDILEAIKGKFGAIDTVAESDLLKKAFGTEEAVALVKLLSQNIGALNGEITAIGANKGMQNAIDMANAMTDPWQRVSSGVTAASITIGTQLLPVLIPMLDSINKGLESFIKWNEINPQLAKNLGQIALTLIGVTAAVSAFSLLSGLATISTVLWNLTLNLALKPLWSMGKAIWAALPSVWAFTAALFANPITWWIVGITALVALVGAAIVYWKEWTGVVIDFGGRFLEMIGVFTLVDNVLAAWEGLKNWWAGFKAWLLALNPFDAIVSGMNKAIALANQLPGIDIKPIGASPVATGPTPSKTGGGLMKQMTSIMNGQKTSTVGDVHVHNYGTPMSGAKLLDELRFAGG